MSTSENSTSTSLKWDSPLASAQNSVYFMFGVVKTSTTSSLKLVTVLRNRLTLTQQLICACRADSNQSCVLFLCRVTPWANPTYLLSG